MRALVMIMLLCLSGRANAVDIWSQPAEPKAHKILQYVDQGRESGATPLIVLEAGRADGLVQGSLLTTYRPSSGTEHGPVWVETGRVKVVDVQERLTIARVVEDATTMSKAFFPNFPGVMAGDMAVEQKITVARRQSVTPTVAVSYFDLFEDPKADPRTFELSSTGREQLREIAQAFAGSRLSLLMVEGYTDHKGPASANQVESYQRALTVRQFLIDELGFDESRVMAIGYGESEQVDQSLAPGFVANNRRIVLKAVPIPN